MRSVTRSLLGIELLKYMVSAESAATLARYAVFAPWEPFGQAAAKGLRSQRKHDYVPLLLAGLQSPTYSLAVILTESPYTGQVFTGTSSIVRAGLPGTWPWRMPRTDCDRPHGGGTNTSSASGFCGSFALAWLPRGSVPSRPPR